MNRLAFIAGRNYILPHHFVGTSMLMWTEKKWKQSLPMQT